jgi:hypothetical protein
VVGVPQTVSADAIDIRVEPVGTTGLPPNTIYVGAIFNILFRVNQQYTGTASGTLGYSVCQSCPSIWEIHYSDIPSGVEIGHGNDPIYTVGNYVAFLKLIIPPGAALAGYVDFHVVPMTTTATTPAGSATDWAVTSVSLSPPNPHVGDQVTFSMVMTALSSPAPFPQSFSAQCVIDGASCGGGSLTYSGPIGAPYTVSAQTPWTATPGAHTLAWGVATIPVGLDPNKSNNAMSKSFTVAPQAQFDFSISISPPQQTVTPGAGTSYTVTVNLASGAAQGVTLSLEGTPAGVSGSFSPTSGSPPFSSTLSVTTMSTAFPGTLTLTVTGSGGGVTRKADVALTVSQAPDFRIDVDPSSQSAFQGQTVSYKISVVGLNGFNSEVSLAVSGLPSDASGVISVPSASPNFDSTLTVTLPKSVPTGSFTLMVKGTGDGLTRVANLVLSINQASETLTPTSTQTSNTVASSPQNELMDILRQNSLFAFGLIIAILLLAVVALRRRKSSGLAARTQGVKMGTVFCPQCGTRNPAANEFCGKCGAKIRCQ